MNQQPFDHETWKTRVATWWRDAARDLPGAMQRLGVRSAYGLLTASAWRSVARRIIDQLWGLSTG